MKLGWVMFHTVMVCCTGGLWFIPLIIWWIIK